MTSKGDERTATHLGAQRVIFALDVSLERSAESSRRIVPVVCVARCCRDVENVDGLGRSRQLVCALAIRSEDTFGSAKRTTAATAKITGKATNPCIYERGESISGRKLRLQRSVLTSGGI